MTQILILNEAKLAEIREVVKKATASPLSLEFVQAGAVTPPKDELKLADRKPGFERPLSASVLIPRGFRAAFSIEHQPAGLCDHLSVSVDRPGKLPSPEAVNMIAEAFGMGKNALQNSATTWLEEFDLGHQAINLVKLHDEKPS